MPTEFNMPKLGLTMEEGTIIEWMVVDGTEVAPGSAVLMVETDKVETEVEISDGGRLHIVVPWAAPTVAASESAGSWPPARPRPLRQWRLWRQ